MKKSYKDIAPDEIFMDSKNLPDFCDNKNKCVSCGLKNTCYDEEEMKNIMAKKISGIC